MLLKFFTNKNASAYLRGMAEEFGESTNAIRHELNNLSNAGYLVAEEQGRTIQYKANTEHPLYPELKSLVFKYLGLDQIVENIVRKLGRPNLAFLVGDYAKGRDSGLIELVLVGDVDLDYLSACVKRVEKLIKRKVSTRVLSSNEFELERDRYRPETTLLLWQE